MAPEVESSDGTSSSIASRFGIPSMNDSLTHILPLMLFQISNRGIHQGEPNGAYMALHRITALPGDGTGREVMIEAMKLLRTIESNSPIDFKLQRFSVEVSIILRPGKNGPRVLSNIAEMNQMRFYRCDWMAWCDNAKWRSCWRQVIWPPFWLRSVCKCSTNQTV